MIVVTSIRASESPQTQDFPVFRLSHPQMVVEVWAWSLGRLKLVASVPGSQLEEGGLGFPRETLSQ